MTPKNLDRLIESLDRDRARTEWKRKKYEREVEKKLQALLEWVRRLPRK